MSRIQVAIENALSAAYTAGFASRWGDLDLGTYGPKTDKNLSDITRLIEDAENALRKTDAALDTSPEKNNEPFCVWNAEDSTFSDLRKQSRIAIAEGRKILKKAKAKEEEAIKYFQQAAFCFEAEGDPQIAEHLLYAAKSYLQRSKLCFKDLENLAYKARDKHDSFKYYLSTCEKTNREAAERRNELARVAANNEKIVQDAESKKDDAEINSNTITEEFTVVNHSDSHTELSDKATS